MEEWLLTLRGPVFRFAVMVAALGLLRELILGLYGASFAYYRANDKNLPWSQMGKTTAGWMVPVKNLFTNSRKIHGFLSFIMHVGVIVTPLLLLDHALLWKAGLGLGFIPPSVSKGTADALTLVTILAAAGLVVSRLASKTARPLSKFQDYALLLLIIVIFAAGFIASRPWNPISYTSSMVIHVLAADAALILMPFTKLAHVAIYPVLRFSGELGWKFPARAGEEVALTISRKEVRPI